jgi:hypothetical protein
MGNDCALGRAYNTDARAQPGRRSKEGVMREMIVTFVVAFLVIVDFAKYNGRHTEEAKDFVWHYAGKIVR